MPNVSTTGDVGRGKTAYYQLLPYLSLQAVVVDLEVTVLLMNQWLLISIIEFLFCPMP